MASDPTGRPPRPTPSLAGLLALALLAGAPFPFPPVSAAADQRADLDRSKPFLLLQASNPATLDRELERAAAAGYRIVCVSPAPATDQGFWYASGIAVLLERPPAATPPHAYRVVRWPPGTLAPRRWHEVLDGPAAAGFRFVPGFALAKEWGTRIVGGETQSHVWILERPPSAARPIEYRVDTALNRGSLDRHIAAGEAAGFEVAALLGLPGVLTLVMQRDSGAVATPPTGGLQARYRYFDALSDAALRARVGKAAAEGYRVRDLGSCSLRAGARMVLLERAGSDAAPHAYEFASGRDRAALERALDEAGARGFRLHPRAFALTPLLLEKPPGSAGVYRYRVLGAPAEPPVTMSSLSQPVSRRVASDLESDLVAAAAEGYHVVGMHYPDQIVLEKVGASAGP